MTPLEHAPVGGFGAAAVAGGFVEAGAFEAGGVTGASVAGAGGGVLTGTGRGGTGFGAPTGFTHSRSWGELRCDPLEEADALPGDEDGSERGDEAEKVEEPPLEWYEPPPPPE